MALTRVPAHMVSVLPPFDGAAPLILQDVLKDFFSVKDAGAVGNGIANDTAAISAALSAAPSASIVYFPAGTYIVDAGALSVTDKKLTIRGAGIGATTIKVTGSGVGIDLTTTAVEAGVYSISDIGFDTETVGTCTAIRVTDTKTGVNGGYDVLHLRNVLVDSSASGYWRIGLHARDCGGVYASGLTIRNNNSFVAQADANTIGVYLENPSASRQVIRQIFLNSFYVQRFYRGIQVNAVNHIESLNISQGEIVGCMTGLYCNGTGQSGSGYLSGVHIDAIGDCIRFDCRSNLWRLADNDLRKTNNGGGELSGALITINAYGESMVITGNLLSGKNHVTPAFEYRGVDVTTAYDRIVVSGNIFRNMDIGIQMPLATEYNIDGTNVFDAVTVPVGTMNGDAGSFLGLAENVDSANGTYSGDLDLLAGAITGLNVRRIEDGATNLPSGTVASGSHVETFVWDINAAKQVFYAATASGGIFFRRKWNGVWGSWQQFTLV